jgi:hypothetical protein
MGADADGLEGVPEMFHETWAQILEVVIGIILLSREVDWVWPLPLVLIFRRFAKSRCLFVDSIDVKVCSCMSRNVAKHLQPDERQTQLAVAVAEASLAVEMQGVAFGEPRSILTDVSLGVDGANHHHHPGIATRTLPRYDIALLGDVFGALDGETEARVFQNLFAPDNGGLGNKCTTSCPFSQLNASD